MSKFANVQKMPDDPILHLPFLFAADQNPNKVNLGIGAYKDDLGNPVVLSCVRKAEQQLLDRRLDKEYLPIAGLADFNSATLKLIFGPQFSLSHPKQLFAMQTIGGTGALRIGNKLLSTVGFPQIYIPQPTWPNHNLILKYAGMHINMYPYYDSDRHTFEFNGMCDAIQKMKAGDVILLHACCHNPSGVDPNMEQWKEIAALVKKRELIPFFDFAYQGFGNGIEEDAQAVRYFAEQDLEMFVASSYSKNLGLYGERVGMLTIITNDEDSKVRVASQCKQIVRANYSMPPLQGARIVTTVLNSEPLYNEWMQELAGMRNRIKEMRKALVTKLDAHGIHKNIAKIEKENGLFSYVGLTQDLAEKLRSDFAIYMPKDGRINFAGLNSKNIDYVVNAIATVLKNAT